MNSIIRKFPRRQQYLIIGLLTAILATQVWADTDQGQFKQGCESGAGSYVENRDGSFQCNLRSGGVIKCADTKTQCTYTAHVSQKLVMQGLRAGKLSLVMPAKSTKPTPAVMPVSK